MITIGHYLTVAAGLNESPLPVPALNGERVRVRGSRLLQRLLPPLTLALSPFALSSAMGRGDTTERVATTRGTP
jgi:hypothetical protein